MTYWSVMYGGMLWFTALAIFSLHVAASEFKPKRRDKPTSQPTEPALPGEG
jgi:hypothetical protein